MVDRLKKANVGETVSFLVSRVVDDDDEKKSNSSERENRPPTPVGSVANRGAGSDKVSPLGFLFGHIKGSCESNLPHV